ncbi:MAG: crossover junction endodeoxyribonuclease RuvC [Tissierellales bacterium]|nr:crossover junction endodeoxyribonuclease RuvC [Tissierellales bacterium]
MIIIGIDPGIATVGYGIIESTGNRLRAIDYGPILTSSDLSMPNRLNIIFDELNKIIEYFKPKDMAVEELFFNKNVKTAITVGHARGVEILSAVKNGLEIYEYTPLQIKQSVVGYGRADKQQVQFMVKTLLNLDEIPKPDDVADALAVAICHSSCYKFKDLFLMK